MFGPLFWPCSQFCSYCTGWPASVFSILLSYGPMHRMLEEYGKVSSTPNGQLKLVCLLLWWTISPILQNPTNLTNSSTVWERICKYKQPVVEPRQSSLFPLAIDVSNLSYILNILLILSLHSVFTSDISCSFVFRQDFMTKLKDSSTSGAVFFAVCRGKVWFHPEI